MKNTFEKIYDTVRKIPFGKVATYGQIARMVGNSRLSRAVGYAMHSAPEDVPCQRVVNRFGGLADAFEPFGKETHRMLLEIEGVEFKADGCVDLEKYLWQEI
ncbi:MAG: MGMT family protein [Oscillospiraceae bacterium]|nr:MGMT family protein [Oscillospiraceae bacterium]